MTIPYWITDTLVGLPAFLWVYGVVGGLFALALLPRTDWRRFAEAVALAFALGPAVLTAWMFVLGQLGAASQSVLLTRETVLLGTLLAAAAAFLVAWRKLRPRPRWGFPPLPLAADEKLLLVLIAAGMVVSWVVVAYWPFTAYDALWVYGYEGRLYSLLGYLPNTIGYYPQFLPLQYTFTQLGGINDHTARAVLPFLHAGSILAAYTLGARLVNRRTGIVAAALWALYPHVGEWSRAGDLEIPLAFLFTLAAAYFLAAWLGREPRTRYALIAGLLFGIGMWTKPTMGAFALGMALLLALELLRVRFDLRRWWVRGKLALVTGLAAAPLGGIWYARNLLLGLDPLVFPPPFWQTLAERSGGEFGWVLAALVTWTFYLARRYPRYDWRLGWLGLLLVGAALVPSILDPRRLVLHEFALLAAGFVLIGIVVRRAARSLWDEELRATAAAVGWVLALALPYFVTWFYSYSYHYRLSFAVVPLLILPTAVALARLFYMERLRSRVFRLAYLACIVIVALPGVIAPVNDLNGGGDYLWTDKYPDDTARYRSGNAALMSVVDGLQVWRDEHPGERLIVAAPGVDRLPFFFPLEDIRVDEAPTRLAALADAAYFVYGQPEGVGTYQPVPPLQNQVVGALNRQDIMRRAWGMDDGIFRYDVYELNLENRWTMPEINGREEDDVVFGGFVRYLGYDIGGLELWQGRRVVMHLYWEVLAAPPEDYSIFIHLRDADDNLSAFWDDPVARGENGYYSTLVWEPGEYIRDARTLMLPDGVAPVGEGYRIVIGIYQSETNARVPVTVNGEPAGDSFDVENRIAIVGEAPA